MDLEILQNYIEKIYGYAIKHTYSRDEADDSVSLFDTKSSFISISKIVFYHQTVIQHRYQSQISKVILRKQRITGSCKCLLAFGNILHTQHNICAVLRSTVERIQIFQLFPDLCQTLNHIIQSTGAIRHPHSHHGCFFG